MFDYYSKENFHDGIIFDFFCKETKTTMTYSCTIGNAKEFKMKLMQHSGCKFVVSGYYTDYDSGDYITVDPTSSKSILSKHLDLKEGEVSFSFHCDKDSLILKVSTLGEQILTTL